MDVIQTTIFYLLASTVLAFLVSPAVTWFLYRYNIRRKSDFDDTHRKISGRAQKAGTPIMGGLVVVIVVVAMTLLYNWERSYTFVPIGALLLTAALGAIDDLLNLFGRPRRQRSFSRTLKLIRVHKNFWVKVWLTLTLPWVFYSRLFSFLGSRFGGGLQPHEKLLVQLAAGGSVAYWIFFKVGWHFLWIPFLGTFDIGAWMIPIIVLLVMITANAVNITDGMDGLGGGLLIFAFAALLFTSFVIQKADPGFAHIGYLCATVIGALITYTYFNVKPARYEMGDIGALALGTLLSVVAIALHREIVLLVAGALFYFDGFISVVLQKVCERLTGRRIFRMAPFHHHLELRGWSEEKTVMRFWILGIFFAFIGVWISLY